MEAVEAARNEWEIHDNRFDTCIYTDYGNRVSIYNGEKVDVV